MKLASPFNIDFDIDVQDGSIPPGEYNISLAYLGYDHDSEYLYTLGIPSLNKKVKLDRYSTLIIKLKDKPNEDAIAIGILVDYERISNIIQPEQVITLQHLGYRSPLGITQGSRVPYTEPRDTLHFWRDGKYERT